MRSAPVKAALPERAARWRRRRSFDRLRRAAQDSRPMGADLLKESLALYDERRWEEAAASVVALLAEQPANVSAWFQLGNVRGEQGRDGDAVDCFRRALTLDPAHARSWNNLGSASQRLGRGGATLAAYPRAPQREPA